MATVTRSSAEAAAGGAPAAIEPAAAPISNWCLIHDYREIVLREGTTVLGRGGQDVVVFDSPTVSRHHAVIRVDGEHATVERPRQQERHVARDRCG